MLHCIIRILRDGAWNGVTALSTFLLVIVAVIAALYAKRQLDEFRREDRIKHLNDLVTQFEQRPMASFRQALASARFKDGKLQPKDVANPPYGLHEVMNFFEHMGYLLDGGYLELEGVSTEFHYWIFHIWSDAKEVVAYEQKDSPVYYKYFKEMEQKLEDLERKEGREFRTPSKEDLEDFYSEEVRLPAGSPVPRQRRRRKSVP